MATCEKISEAYLVPVLEEMLEAFPFVILGIHSDNGSEYINYTVAKLLEKLRIDLTKSRPDTRTTMPWQSQKMLLWSVNTWDTPISPRFCPGGQRLLPGAPEPLRERPPPLLLPEDRDRCQGKGEEELPVSGHEDAL